MNHPPENATLDQGRRFAKPIRRRDLLGLGALWSFLVTGFAMAAGVLRLPMPSVFPETGSRFRIGPPDRFPTGATPMNERNLLVLRDSAGIRALSRVCTHLGCITQREPEGPGFVCPCHGSRFDGEGKVVQGPAPSGLRYHEVSRAPNGDLFVDQDRTVPPETRFPV